MKRIIYLMTLLFVIGIRAFGQSTTTKEDPSLHEKIQSFVRA